MFGVSTMTIHRDLDHLAAEGLLRKVRGGAVSIHSLPGAAEECPTCHGPAERRNSMVLHMEDGAHRRACCAHCGLLAMTDSPSQVASALATDYLYGRMVNVRSASYVVAPQITVCCTPTVLAFENRADAERFRIGFGGQVMSIQDALAYLQREMNL